MSLRLLPAIVMDNDEDDDGNFTKWMSSYWGHGAESGHSRDRKRSFRRPARTQQADRRGSLPTVSQLDAMKLNRLHAVTMAASPSHIKNREDKSEVRPHPRARRCSSDENSRHKTSIAEARICTIPEITESLEKRLNLRENRAMSLSSQTEDDRLCLICHENMRKNGLSIQELHCTHRFHKEAVRRLEQRRQSSEAAAACQVHRHPDERRKSADGHISTEKEPPLYRQLSLRKHR